MAFAVLSKETHFNFAGFCRYAYIISGLCILMGIAAIFWNGGLRYGADFAGGVMVQVQFEKPIGDEQVKHALEGVDLPGLTIQQVGSDGDDYLLRFASQNTDKIKVLREQVMGALKSRIPGNAATIARLESVGPKVGSDLRNMAIEALFYAVLLITVYISGRFEHSWFVAGGMSAVLFAAVYFAGYFGFNRLWGVALGLMVTIACCWKLKLNFALGAILALMHDVMVVTGLITLLGVEIDLNTIAALLTIIGYSINDTIVVYDRIRENLRAIPADADVKPTMAQVINDSVNQTLARTIMTSATTIMASLALYFLGGSVIHNFALTMCLGVIFGTWSSIFIASPILMSFGDIGLYHKKAQVRDDFERPGEHGVV
ncbi:MAG: protein translocase subunit SecF [Mailhella sp.]|nr:protein translocase subunit SecF [Mailhella sp.]